MSEQLRYLAGFIHGIDQDSEFSSKVEDEIRRNAIVFQEEAKNWSMSSFDDGKTFYRHKVTNASRWTDPAAEANSVLEFKLFGLNLLLNPDYLAKLVCKRQQPSEADTDPFMNTSTSNFFLTSPPLVLDQRHTSEVACQADAARLVERGMATEVIKMRSASVEARIEAVRKNVSVSALPEVAIASVDATVQVESVNAGVQAVEVRVAGIDDACSGRSLCLMVDVGVVAKRESCETGFGDSKIFVQVDVSTEMEPIVLKQFCDAAVGEANVASKPAALLCDAAVGEANVPSKPAALLCDAEVGEDFVREFKHAMIGDSKTDFRDIAVDARQVELSLTLFRVVRIAGPVRLDRGTKTAFVGVNKGTQMRGRIFRVSAPHISQTKTPIIPKTFRQLDDDSTTVRQESVEEPPTPRRSRLSMYGRRAVKTQTAPVRNYLKLRETDRARLRRLS